MTTRIAEVGTQRMLRVDVNDAADEVFLGVPCEHARDGEHVLKMSRSDLSKALGLIDPIDAEMWEFNDADRDLLGWT